jgi:serine/threonine protein kinase
MDTRSLASVIGAELLRASMLGKQRPRLVDRYDVVGLLGQGASGVVVRALDTRLQRNVALKLAPLSSTTERMLVEARALAQLRRPRHVVQVMEFGSGSLVSASGSIDVAYVSMELVDGETMRTWLARGDRSLEQVVAAFQCLADGLACVHAHGIVHGDVKPDNAIIGNDGVPMLVDFGFAAAVRADGEERSRGEIVGTGPYLAPEARRGVIERGSDVYALAVAMWEALTGAHPFADAGGPQTNWYGALQSIPDEDTVPKPVRALLRRALHPKASRRPSAQEFHRTLETFRATLMGRLVRYLGRAYQVYAFLCVSLVTSVIVLVAIAAIQGCVK